MAACARLLNCCRVKLCTKQSNTLVLACSRGFAAKKTDAKIDKGPKRPTTTFITYHTSIHDELSQKYPDKSVPEKAKIASEMYKNLSEQEKQSLSEAYSADMEQYKQEKASWWNSLTPEQQDRIKHEQDSLALKRKEERAVKEASKPKHPAYGYTLFVKQKWDSLSYGERSEANVIEKGRLLAKEWSNLTQEQKQDYDNETERAAYNEKLFEWEKLMVEKGVPSLVRASTLKQLTVEQMSKKTAKKTTGKTEKKPAKKGEQTSTKKGTKTPKS